ncbi:MAG: class I SAM-dependent methyltransferase [Bacilli bacterium]|nr:class I SAM-dependent methyltransferase [Bacilli bacterium]
MPKRLSKRLSAIADLVPQGAYVADVGSDHAWLPIFLVESGKIDWAMAIDNKIGPYLRMKENVASSAAKNHIVCSCSDGISALSDGVDTLIVAGMGGRLACEILEAHPEKLGNVRTIIVDPHRDLMAVRKRVTELGFHIEEETMVKEDRIYYTVIRFVRGFPEVPYSPNELAFGPVLMRQGDPIYVEWLSTQKGKIGHLLDKPDINKEKRDTLLKMYRSISHELQTKVKPTGDN